MSQALEQRLILFLGSIALENIKMAASVEAEKAKTQDQLKHMADALRSAEAEIAALKAPKPRRQRKASTTL